MSAGGGVKPATAGRFVRGGAAAPRPAPQRPPSCAAAACARPQHSHQLCDRTSSRPWRRSRRRHCFPTVFGARRRPRPTDVGISRRVGAGGGGGDISGGGWLRRPPHANPFRGHNQLPTRARRRQSARYPCAPVERWRRTAPPIPPKAPQGGAGPPRRPGAPSRRLVTAATGGGGGHGGRTAMAAAATSRHSVGPRCGPRGDRLPAGNVAVAVVVAGGGRSRSRAPQQRRCHNRRGRGVPQGAVFPLLPLITEAVTRMRCVRRLLLAQEIRNVAFLRPAPPKTVANGPRRKHFHVWTRSEQLKVTWRLAWPISKIG